MLDRLFEKIFKSSNELLSFTPKTFEEDNEIYVQVLNVLTSRYDWKNNNIALEGDYGTGKSSILEQFINGKRRFCRIKTISFLSLNSEIKKSEEKVGSAAGLDDEISAKIQKEIVKQLYYGESPNKLKRSGYRRIGKTYFLPSLLIAAIIMFFIIVGLCDIDIHDVLSSFDTSSFREVQFGRSSIVCLLAFSCGVAVLAVFINSFIGFIFNGSIKNISAENLSIELNDTKPDFDQLIDLIMFYFRKTHTRIIIFEDLDRFNNTGIFEELRQLNYILNSKRGRLRKIKFIYAVRSDLFESDSSGLYNRAFARTKLFDIIVPIVPFLSKMNMMSVIEKECSRAGLKHVDAKKMASLIGSHTSDMRTVKYIINSLLVYSKKFDLEKSVGYDNCIALSVVRAFYPEEFNKLSSGGSILDKIYESLQSYKSRLIRENENKYTDSGIIHSHSDEIWDKLRSLKTDAISGRPSAVVVDGADVPVDSELLIRIYHCKENVQMNWQGVYGATFFTKDEIDDVYVPLINKYKNNKEKFRNNNNISERNVFDYYNDIENESYNEKYVLIKDLICNGFINEDYLNYISQNTSHEGEESESNRFLYRNIRGGVVAEKYPLNDDTIECLLSNTNNADFASSGVYNYYLLNFLVKRYETYLDKIDIILESADANLDRFMAFYESYCEFYADDISSLDYDLFNNMKTTDMIGLVPLLFLTELISKKYPSELVNRISDSNIISQYNKEILFSIAIIGLDAPELLKLSERGLKLLNLCNRRIAINENQGEKLLRIYVCNSIPIPNLALLGLSKARIKETINDILISFNKVNVEYIDVELLEEYTQLRKISKEDFIFINCNANDAIKEYLARNISNILMGDDIGECYEACALYIIRKKMALDQDAILQYANKISRDLYIAVIYYSKLDVDGLRIVLVNSQDEQLIKISSSNKRIIIDRNDRNKRFGEFLKRTGLIKNIYSKADKYCLVVK